MTSVYKKEWGGGSPKKSFENEKTILL